jgi:tRNA A-37 threonylcarbamoyl transferase component Bud32/dienelactone hydrolase
MATAKTLGHYLLETEIGSGGMGIVYAATDESLGRRVAVKLLRQGALSDDSHRHRFRREAQAASALNHPHIVTIHEIGSSDGDDFIVMEIVEGATLRTAIPPGGLPIEEALRYAIQLASAVGAAHAAGIVHRDIKPANILLTADGRVKLADFGLAKLVLAFSEEASTATALTSDRFFAGTPGYASPEQIRGEAVDARTDVFAIGCILYEMLTGARAFEPRPGQSVFAAVLENEPAPPRTLRRGIPRDLERIALRALEKRADARYASGAEMLAELESVQARLAARKVSLLHALQRPPIAIAAALILIVAGVAGGLGWREWKKNRWIEDVALPAAAAHIEKGERLAAFRILRKASELRPEDPSVRQALTEVSDEVLVTSTPIGADVYIRGFFDPPDSWEHVGRTPMRVGLPNGPEMFLFRVALEGYSERVFAGTATYPTWAVPLTPLADARTGMVLIKGAVQLNLDPARTLKEFWIDELEVTNRDYLTFVRAGGYAADELWEGTPPELRRTYVDLTGRPGPSTWTAGEPPDGTLEHPVGGVSWYEARAYCRAAGKELPTFLHWNFAAALGATTHWAHLSRFEADDSAPVGHHLRMNAQGTYDMAGNVREWAFNESSPGKRAALGGSWKELSYTFSEPAFEPAESRELHLGFRCASYDGPLDEALLAPVRTAARDYRNEVPVGDEAFAVIRGLYEYERGELAARIDAVDDSLPLYRLERVSFMSGYGAGRVRALVLLPRNATPPFQTVILFPGTGVFRERQELALSGGTKMSRFLISSGRALVLPEYDGSFTRWRGNPPFRELTPRVVKDLRRTVDYLESRSDVDAQRLGYWGLSSGAAYGPMMAATEPRLRAAVLVAGGLYPFRVRPEVDVINFAPRAHVPTLMINGKHDYAFNYETTQKPMFALLGTDQKRHVVFESGHIPSEWNEVTRETLDWYDRYLGPVELR